MKAEYLVSIELPEGATPETLKSWVDDALASYCQVMSFAKEGDMKEDNIFVSEYKDDGF